MSTSYFTYIVRCNDNTLYTGYARDLKERINKHNLGKAAKYTRGRLPVQLVYYETFASKQAAMQRERQIKKLNRKAKLALTEVMATMNEVAAEKIVPKDPEGILYLCATPLGNLEDITLRALKVLRECDLIAAEDTRRTIKLLNHFEIKTPLTSYHEHNEKTKGARLIEDLLAGRKVALVSDAGMPGISDPGHVIVKLALEQGIKIVPIPGPSAGITALVASGLPTDAFVFEGFLPREKKKRRGTLEALVAEKRTIIIYEAPHRVKQTLKELLTFIGDRQAVIARELTKIHEEFIRGRLSELLAHIEERQIKGEFCLIIEGSVRENDKGHMPQWEGRELLLQVTERIAKGLSKKEALKEVAALMGKSKREVYNVVAKLEEENGSE